MATFRMNIKFVFLLCLPLLSYPAAAHSSGASVSVLDHGAKADGSTDSSKAFADAWRAACDGCGTMVIPKGDYLVGETVFAGPCKGPVTIQMEGTIKAPLDSSKFHEAEWITFDKITGLTLNGGGTFDGQGEEAWTKHACPQSQAHCPSRAVNLKFKHVTNANLENFNSLNPKGFHMCVNTCENFHVSNVKITAPGTSPNTDGIHISHSKDVSITKTVISTGDDCISIIQGDTNITVSEVTCGPGHGISVGSLGKYKDEKDVHGVYVKNCTLKNTLNGVRVKSWRAAPPSAASDIHFEDIIMESVKNPVLIDQEYCGSGKSCRGNQPSQVKLSNIQFKNIRGTSVSQCAVKMACSPVSPCQNVELFDINLQYISNGQVAPATSECSNVKVGSGGKLDPKPCSAGAGTPVQSEVGAASAADE